MGQSISMEENPLLNTRQVEEKVIGAESHENSTDDKKDKVDGDGQDSSTDSDMKTNSVRAAIDSLIETCLGVKSEDGETEDSGKEPEQPTKLIAAPAPREVGPAGDVNVVFSFMKDRIADMIRKDDAEEGTNIPSNRLISAEPVQVIKSESQQTVSESRERQPKLSVYESLKKEDKMPQNTVRLQTLIDKVLDNSLGEDMHSSVPDISLGNISVNSIESTSKSVPTTIVSTSSSTDTSTKTVGSDVAETKRSPEIKCLQNRVVCLMDHIERVLEKSFVNDEVSSTPPTPPIEVARSLAPPKVSMGGSITQGKPITSVATSAGTDGTISVQDIVNRVISQTEVISKLLSPNGEEGSPKENSSTPSDVRKSHPGDHSRDFDRPHHRSPASSASRTAYTETGHDSHADTRMDLHRQWSHKHQQDANPYQQKHMAGDKVKEPKHFDPAGYPSSKYSPFTKQNEAMMAQRYGPRAVAPYLNGTVPRAAMLQNAQMYMLRGHPVYMPPRPFPPPLMRADGMIATETDTQPYPHIPSKMCRCVQCLTFFQFEDKSAKQNKPSPTSSSMMTPPLSQADAAFYQNHLQVPLHAPHGPGMIAQQDMSRLQATSPSKFPNPSSVHMANMMQYQAAAAVHPLKPMSLPAALSQGVPHISDHYNQEMIKSDRRQERNGPHPRQDMYRPGEMPNKALYNRKEEFPTRTADNAMQMVRHAQHPVMTRADVHPGKPLVSLPQPKEDRFPPPHMPVLDLTVKIPESAPIAQPGPTSADTDQPLDLSKKPTQSVSMPRYITRRDGGGSVQINQTDSFSAPESHHLQHLETSVDKLCHQVQGPHGNYSRREIMSSDRIIGDAAACNAVMAPTVVSSMMMSPGGHRPQLHPIPAPTFSTTPSTMAALSPVRPANQVSISHAQGPAPYPTITQEKLSPKPTTPASCLSQAAIQQLRESPQPLASPQGSDKGDPSQRRGSVSRHEPIQSIIGNHPPNDILYLICRLCRQTYGSPYGFRKHFRNQHGFEPRAEHTIVQTISATKSAMQGPYMLNSQDQLGEPLIPTGRSSAPPERETVPAQGSEYYRAKKESLSPVNPRGVSPCQQTQQDWGNGKGRVYRRASDGRPRSALREDADDVKYLECQECKQTFQLNDFGSYKRHCRQHHQARTPGPFIGPESKSEQSDKHLSRPTACQFCGGQFPLMILEDHIKSVHFKEFCSEGQNAQPRKPLSTSISSPTSPEGHTHTSRLDPCFPNSVSELQKYLSEPVHNPNLEIQRLPADQITVSASPDSSSDKQAQSDYAQPTSNSQPQTTACVPDTNSSADCRPAQDKVGSDKANDSNTSLDSKSKDLSYLQVNLVEDDKDSGFSGDRCSSSESRSLSIESAQDGGSQASPAEVEDSHSSFYRHKKFGGHRKRKESCETQEADSKIPKLDQSNGANSKEKDSSAQSSGKGDTKPDLSVTDCNSSSDKGSEKELVPEPAKKPETRTKQEARHQLPFVWDRVTRIQAGKNIKPPDYMT